MNPFLKAYIDILLNGEESYPRGKKIKEIENYRLDLHPIYNRFTSFRARRMNLDYAKFEMGWYLRGNRFEMTIADKAQMWKDIVDVDGGINSNYGQYIFHNQAQYKWVVQELLRDKDSRRAVMTLLNHTHLRDNNPDIVCTYSIGFRIRKDRLNMTIHMRSWDAIWGMTNDVFCFSVIYEIIFSLLKDKYPNLKYGEYVHTADSIHVYERHFEMLETLVREGMKGYEDIECPPLSGKDEALYLVNHEFSYDPPPEFPFSKWLLEGYMNVKD